MIKIIHISDLHFNTQRDGILEPLIQDINTEKADIIVVSGDLTQRARLSQFNAANDFLRKLENKKIICVPGNHDISLYNPLERFIIPFYKYNIFIRKNFLEYYVNDKMVIFGVNSVTPYRAMGGEISQKQLEKVKTFFSKHPDTIKVIVMHHNLVKSERHKNMFDAEKIINTFADLNINLILSGHIHVAYIEQLKRNYLAHNMYVITAGTAVSTRTIQANSYNIIEFPDRHHFQLTVRAFKDGQFSTASINQYSL